MSPRFAKWILGLLGWKVQGTVPDTLKKYIVIVAPHTSWWDFPLGVFARAATGRHIYYLGKASLFKPPFGGIMRWLGGYPVNRSKRTRMVDQVIALFDENTEFAIALAPEGTRSKVSEFKTGFYYIARGAHIPIICVRFDYAKRVVFFDAPFYPTDDAEADLRTLWNHFVGVQGKRKDLSITEPK